MEVEGLRRWKGFDGGGRASEKGGGKGAWELLGLLRLLRLLWFRVQGSGFN